MGMRSLPIFGAFARIFASVLLGAEFGGLRNSADNAAWDKKMATL
jgi:hypothetical protein